MRHSNVQNFNQGFTVLETLVVIVMVGIIASLTAPSFLAWNQKKQVDSATAAIEGSIKEAQREAMSQASSCDVSFNIANPEKPIVTSGINCLTTGDRQLENVTLTPSDTAISFNSLGESSSDTAGNVTIVVTHVSNPNLKKCLVVSKPLGLIGSGEYTGTGASEANCKP
ncbi:MAG: type II secretion system protein [Sphaerospermopsis sp. SIO1G2]|nr:type II secretion system protein [Sphaerospermopsis sp. SIO1G2]